MIAGKERVGAAFAFEDAVEVGPGNAEGFSVRNNSDVINPRGFAAFWLAFR